LQSRTLPRVPTIPFVFTVEKISQPFEMPISANPLISSTTPVTPNRIPFVLFSLWLGGFAATAFMWVKQWRPVRYTLRHSPFLRLDIPTPAMSCAERLEPGVFGIFNPILLLPEGLSERLSPTHMDVVIAHELCHVRRRDNLAAAIHMVVES